MLYADADLPPREGPAPVPIVRQIDLNELAFPSSFVRSEFSPARQRLEEALVLLRSGRGEAIMTVDHASIDAARISEKAELLHHALSPKAPSGAVEIARQILRSVDYGADLDDAGRFNFFTELRAHDELDTERALGAVSNRRQADVISNSVVRTALQEIAASLKEPALRERFLSESISDKQLIDVLKYASSKQRVDFIVSMRDFAERQPLVADFMRGKLDNALYFATPDERLTLIKQLLPGADDEITRAAVNSVLRSSRNLEELIVLVDKAGQDNLWRNGDPGFREMVGHAVLGPKMREMPFPMLLEAGAGEEAVKKSFDRTRACFEEIIRICEQDEKLGRTQVAKDFARTAREGLENLTIDAGDLRGNHEELRKLANVYSEMGRLGMRYGVSIGYSSDDLLSHNPSHSRMSKLWTEKDMRDIGAVLETLPESHLLFTPILRQIQRSSHLGTGVLGARYEDGVIKIADSAIEHRGVETAYKGISSLRVVLIHEIGHGVQIGSGPGWVRFDRNGKAEVGLGEAIFEFNDFMKIGGWRVYDRDRYTLSSTPGKIVLDGKEHPLGRAVEHQGERLVLQYHKTFNALIGYRADAQFSHRDYAHASPWEDFAEAFAEYMLLPERLIEDAPDKFLYMELEFRRYHADPAMLRKLDRALDEFRRDRMLERVPVLRAPDEWVL